MLSGVPIAAVVTGAYLLLGLIVALTGLMQTAYGGYSTTTLPVEEGDGAVPEVDADGERRRRQVQLSVTGRQLPGRQAARRGEGSGPPAAAANG